MPRGMLTVLSALVLLVTAAPAQAQAHTQAQTKAQAEAQATTVTFTGRGFGHGIGMSQYGALGRANAGQTFRQILGFYYPGTRWGTTDGKVKVLITGDTSRDVVVQDRPGLTVSRVGGRTWRPGQAARWWRIEPDSTGSRSVISDRTGRWHRWRTVAGEAEFAAGGEPVALRTPDGTVSYRGALRSARPGTGRVRDTVTVLPLESYLRGVVPSEVPALWPADAVKSQAVAARTYAAYERDAAPRGRYYQICDTAHCQAYPGTTNEHPDSDRAVKATAHQVRTYGGAPAFTQFSASNGGYTVAGAFPYLPAQEDPLDQYPEWTKVVDGASIAGHWPAIGTYQGLTVDQRDGNGSYGGRVLTITVHGSTASTTVSGSTFASYVGLRSTLFTFS